MPFTFLLSPLHSPHRWESEAHSTRSEAAFKAFHAGLPIQDICNAASWSTPLTFIRVYGLDMRATPGSSVLSPSSCSWVIHTGQGLGSLAAWASRSPQSVYRTHLEFLKRNASGYVCIPGSSKERDAESRCYTSCIPASILLNSLKVMPAASHVLLYQMIITSPHSWCLV